MLFKIDVTLPTPDGPAGFNPDAVAAIQPDKVGAIILLIGGFGVPVACTPEQAANSLWRFTDALGDGSFINPIHLQAVIPGPSSSTCQMVMAGGHTSNQSTSVEDMLAFLRKVNASRNVLVGEL